MEATDNHAVETQVTVGSKVGLHARPAAAVAKAAAALDVPVMIASTGAPVPAASLLSLLSLGAEQGDTVTLTASGEGAAEAVATLAALIASDLDEPA